MTDLLTLYAEAAARLAYSPDVDAWEDDADAPRYRTLFQHGDLPAPPADLATDAIFVRRGTHTYASLSVDGVQLFAPPEAYRSLGLWIIACLLEPGWTDCWLRLTHPESEVRHVGVERSYRRPDGHSAGLYTQPHAAVYYPEPVGAFPLADQAPPLPRLLLTDRHDRFAGFGDAQERDTLVGFGSDLGAWRFAEVLLNASQPWSPRVEVNFEGPYGFGGVEPDSAEVRLWLPGSAGWNAVLGDDLDFTTPGRA